MREDQTWQESGTIIRVQLKFDASSKGTAEAAGKNKTK